LRQEDGVSTHQEELAMSHVDDIHQAEDDDEAHRDEQQRQHEVGGIKCEYDRLLHDAAYTDR
jgi:hypothetical protein